MILDECRVEMWNGTNHYHTSNSHECRGVNGEALQLHAVYKKPAVFFTASHARICISTTSHVRIRIR